MLVGKFSSTCTREFMCATFCQEVERRGRVVAMVEEVCVGECGRRWRE
jgi:hypothetical protein